MTGVFGAQVTQDVDAHSPTQAFGETLLSAEYLHHETTQAAINEATDDII